MARSFNLDEEIGDRDGALTLTLFAVFAFVSIGNWWINFFGFVFFPAPLLAFLVTRWAYKRHFKLMKRRRTIPQGFDSDPGEHF